MKRRQGFTLIELVIVIAVIGILASIAIPRFQNSLASARGSKIIGELRIIDGAVNAYMAKFGMIPTSMDEITTNDPSSNPPKLELVVLNDNIDGSNFIISQNDGSEKEFSVATGTKYAIENGRATYGGATKTVDYYLGTSNTLAALLGDIKSWQDSNGVTGSVANNSYNKKQLQFYNDGLVKELSASEIATLLPNIDTSGLGSPLYLRSATAVLADGSMADIQYITTQGAMGTTEAKTYISCAFVVNGEVYVNMGANDNTPTMSSYLPGSGGYNTATAVQSLYNKTDASSFVDILLRSHYQKI